MGVLKVSRFKFISLLLIVSLLVVLMSGSVSASGMAGESSTVSCTSYSSAVDTAYSAYEVVHLDYAFMAGGQEDDGDMSIATLESDISQNFFPNSDNLCYKTQIYKTTDYDDSTTANNPNKFLFYSYIYVLEPGIYNFEAIINGDLGRDEGGDKDCNAKLTEAIYKIYSYEGNEDNYIKLNNKLDTSSFLHDLIDLRTDHFSIHEQDSTRGKEDTASGTIDATLDKGVYLLIGLFVQDGDKLGVYENAWCKASLDQVFGSTATEAVKNDQLLISNSLLSEINSSPTGQFFCEANGFDWADDMVIGERCCYSDKLDSSFSNESGIYVCSEDSGIFSWKEHTPEEFCDLNEDCDSMLGVFEGDASTIFNIQNGDDGCCGDDEIILYNFSYTGKKLIPGEETWDVEFSTDGSKIYTVINMHEIDTYSLSTPWDVSTATLNDTFDFISFSDRVQAIKFSTDGAKLYVADIGQGIIETYSLSTPWDVSTATKDSSSFNYWGLHDFQFSTDGSKLYVAGMALGFEASILDYSLSTPWDVSTATHVQNISFDDEYDPGDQDFNNFFIRKDGKTIYTTDYWDHGLLRKWSLSTPWDISTMTFDDSGIYDFQSAIDEFEWNGDPIDRVGRIPVFYMDSSEEHIYIYDKENNRTVYQFEKNVTNFENTFFSNPGYFDPFHTDLGWVSSATNPRYFCSKDWDDNNFITSPTDAEFIGWKWYDALGLGNAFKIHTVNNYDFISNGENWSYCDADGNDSNNNLQTKSISSNANALFDGDTLSEVSDISTGYLCSDYLNELIYNDITPFDNEIFDVGITEGCPSSNPSFCCQENTVLEVDSEGDIDASECESRCYATRSNTIDSFLSVSLSSLFCKLFPASFICIEGLVEEESDDDNLIDMSECDKRPTDCIGFSRENSDISCESIEYFQDMGEQQLPIERGYARACEIKENQFSFCTSPQQNIAIEYVYAKDVEDGLNQTCCLLDYGPSGVGDQRFTSDEVCEYMDNEAMSIDVCIALGGDWQPWTTSEDFSYECTGYEVVVENEGTCCMAGEWEYDFSNYWIQNLAKPQSFICYNHNDEKRIAECCNDFTVCKNAIEPDALFKKESVTHGSQYGAWFRKGGVLHSVDDFNKFNDTGVFKDYARYEFYESSNEDELTIDLNDIEFGDRDTKNWSSFDMLEMDIFTSSFDRLKKVYIVDGNGDNCVLSDSVEDSLVNGNRTLRWHHAVFNITSCNINMNSIQKIEFNISKGIYFEILIDNVFLSNFENSNKNTENYYCTGGFSSWVDNLDGDCGIEHCFDADSVFWDNDGSGFAEYKFACEAQPSYDWTGTACCGDDTKVPIRSMDYSTLSTYGEYYNDTKYGCFHGVPVHSGETVGYAMFENYFNVKTEEHFYDNLIFYNQNFYACEINKFDNLNVSFNGTISNIPLVKDTKTTYDAVGNYICMPEGYWAHKENLDLSRFLASKMYNLTFINSEDQHNYEMYCDNYENLNLEYVAERNLDELILTSCILNVEDKTITGIYFKGSNSYNELSTFINESGLNLHFIDLGLDQDQVDGICSGLTFSSDIEGEKLFYGCGDVGENIYVAYSGVFDMLLFVQDNDPNMINEFDGLFKGYTSFFENMWYSLVNFFSNIFNPDDSISTPTNESSLPYNNELLDYDKLFLSRNLDKTIYAFSSNRLDPGYIRSGSNIFTYQFENFNTDMSKLFQRYLEVDNSGVVYEDLIIDYIYGDGKQIITLINPDNKDFEPEFDWRWYLGGLNVNSSVENGDWEIVNGDGIIQIGEWCEEVPSSPPTVPNSPKNNYVSYTKNIFRYNNNTCHFWDSAYNFGNVECNSSYELDYSNCYECEDSSDCTNPDLPLCIANTCSEKGPYVEFEDAVLSDGLSENIRLYCVGDEGICLPDLFEIMCEGHYKDPDCQTSTGGVAYE